MTATTDAQTTAMDVCPDCAGAGRIILERINGTTAAEPYVYGDCYACHGSGQVDAKAVEHCANPTCHEVFWADEGCTHGTDFPACESCRPANCRECVDERAGDVWSDR